MADNHQRNAQPTRAADETKKPRHHVRLGHPQAIRLGLHQLPRIVTMLKSYGIPHGGFAANWDPIEIVGLKREAGEQIVVADDRVVEVDSNKHH